MNRLIKFTLFACLWVSGAAFAAAGTFVEVTGDVTMTPAGKGPLKVKTGDAFESGAHIVTGKQGKTVLKMDDGEIISLSVATDFTVANYAYNPAAPADGSVVLNLARGGLRFITGLIGKANPSKFALRTPTTTIGIRGSGGTLIVKDGTQTTTDDEGVITVTDSKTGNTITLSPGKDTYTDSTGTHQFSQADVLNGTVPAFVKQDLDDAATLIQQDLQQYQAGTQSGVAPPTPLQNAQSLVNGAGGGGGGTTTSP